MKFNNFNAIRHLGQVQKNVINNYDVAWAWGAWGASISFIRKKKFFLSYNKRNDQAIKEAYICCVWLNSV